MQKATTVILFITNLIGNISRSDLDKIYENIEENLSSSGLKLKISKQKMIDGKIILANSDAIKIKSKIGQILIV